jgi:hypothetical protein
MRTAGVAYYNELLTWKIAVTAYALTMAIAWGEEGGWGTDPTILVNIGLDERTEDKSYAPVTGKSSFKNAQEAAAELQMWFGTLLVQWRKAANITCLDTAKHVLEMMISIETSARVEIVWEMWKHIMSIRASKTT